MAGEGSSAFVTPLTYVFLAGVSTLYVAVLARRAYAVPALMLFFLAWELVVDFRFATGRGITSGYPWWSTSGTRSSRCEGREGLRAGLPLAHGPGPPAAKSD